ncbi:MAG TPA: IS66 family transposase, partial [Gemmatimonadales bacterium]|nr:IS66 family transposase [Gemmatimonadales bacterium]
MSRAIRCFDVLVGSGPLVVDVTEVTSWRERAERAEERAERAERRAEQAEERLAAAEARIEDLVEQVAVLSRMLFGRSSEKGSASAGDPQGLDGADGGDPDGDGDGQGDRPKRGQRPGSKGHGRRDYSHLRSREEIHDVPPDQRVCPDCGVEFTALGSQDSEQIDWQVQLTRIVHRRLRYRRACTCPGQRTVTAPPAPKVIPKGHFTAGFCARLLYLKFVLGLPVHRIAKMLAAEGLSVSEGTLAGVLKALAGLLVPVETAIRARNSAATHVHADETTWRCYEQVEDSTGHRWWLWVFIAEDTVVFRMDATRSNAVLDAQFGITESDRKAGALPGGRHLVMSSDFFVVYQSLGRLDGVDALWCWTHIRRYFIRAGDAHAYLRPWRDAWVARIADLYVAHKAMAAAEVGSPQHHAALAAFERALSVMDTVRRQQAAGPALHPAAAKVLATLDREWDGLARHRDFPDLELDNNQSERALRTPVVGRKNYYGSHAEWSAHLAARIWTITATAERHHLEPLTYLTDYLTACAQTGGKPLQG